MQHMDLVAYSGPGTPTHTLLESDHDFGGNEVEISQEVW